MNMISKFLKDGRHFQIGFLILFMTYGMLFLDWDKEWDRYLVTFASCLAVQAIGIRLTTGNYTGLKSAVISALSLCLMFKGNLLVTSVIAAALSIGSKYLIRYDGKHIFNPTNFGIILTILLTGDAWISPGQWGSGVMLIFLIGVAGSSVLFKVGRLDVGLTFLGVFAALQFVRQVVYLGWELDVFVHQMSSGTLLLFAFFMITDPMTTPNAPRARVIWAASVAILAFGLTNWVYVHSAPVWALFIISPVTLLLDRAFLYKRFQWIRNETIINQ
jgi:Na+-transporting NADH:ubiquinone oxidoreductase subunit NqrB